MELYMRCKPKTKSMATLIKNKKEKKNKTTLYCSWSVDYGSDSVN